ncbi:MAG TPA: NAD-dependent epimerase/dehydratase family protein, partial [Pyrinomonadaceae bacterium]|nr:NAD-dependent epimerase/dehydratase family protein [Pyrinomonadaceae bacterium]
MRDIRARCNEGVLVAELAGKIVLVTGAAGAIGSAIAQAVRKAGGTVIGADLKAGGGLEALDVTDEAQWQRVVA